MAYLGKKRLKAIWESTTRCYKKALMEAHPEHFTGKMVVNIWDDNVDLIAHEFEVVNYLDPSINSGDMAKHLHHAGIDPRSEIIDQLYLKHITTDLSTEELKLVVEAHEKKKINRAKTTIDAILTELLGRSISEKK